MADFESPAFDIDTAFETILSNVQNGVYSGEYEFQADLFRNFNFAKDGQFSFLRKATHKHTHILTVQTGHFRYFPDLLTAAINFRRGNLALVSVSLDGVSIPDIYVLCRSLIREINVKPSVITPIEYS